MPDERQDSIRQGIGVPPESPAGDAAAEERRKRAAEAPPIGGAMGGTSDADRAADEAQMNAARSDAEDTAGEAAPEGDAGLNQRFDERSRVLEETREAGQRAQGGGSSEESDIDRAAQEGR